MSALCGPILRHATSAEHGPTCQHTRQQTRRMSPKQPIVNIHVNSHVNDHIIFIDRQVSSFDR